MEQTEPEDLRENQYIQVEAGEKLPPGGNFFDQEPFLGAIRMAAVKHATNESRLHFALSTLVKQEASRSVGVKQKDLLRLASQALHLTPHDAKPFASALETMRTYLAQYPYYREYVTTQLGHTDYRHDGTAIERKGHYFDQTPTYARWVTDRLRREGRAPLVGIEEIFPQDLKGETVRGALNRIAGGKGRQRNMRWRILKASELARDGRT